MPLFQILTKSYPVSVKYPLSIQKKYFKKLALVNARAVSSVPFHPLCHKINHFCCWFPNTYPDSYHLPGLWYLPHNFTSTLFVVYFYVIQNAKLLKSFCSFAGLEEFLTNSRLFKICSDEVSALNTTNNFNLLACGDLHKNG